MKKATISIITTCLIAGSIAFVPAAASAADSTGSGIAYTCGVGGKTNGMTVTKTLINDGMNPHYDWMVTFSDPNLVRQITQDAAQDSCWKSEIANVTTENGEIVLPISFVGPNEWEIWGCGTGQGIYLAYTQGDVTNSPRLILALPVNTSTPLSCATQQ